VRLCLVTVLVATAASVCAPAALADATNSSNWAGYAVHHPGVSFRAVSSTWRQPKVRCTPGTPAYSAFWVGLGGYNLHSSALEQIGTEVDCSPSGRIVSNAWYELVPAPPVPIKLIVRPGDLIRASVSVANRRVSVRLHDLTRRRRFHQSMYAPTTDVSSAEWIVEAPSECASAGSCRTLPLANFASATFGSASARTTAGHSGSISDPAWRWTRITLKPGGRRFASYGVQGTSAPAAAPTALSSRGSVFKVDYRPGSARGRRAARGHSAPVSAGALVHPGR
jgi:Peptidase A4 family